MTETTRKYNPGFLTDDELVASFCVRTGEFESMIEALRECRGHANTHKIQDGRFRVCQHQGRFEVRLRVNVFPVFPVVAYDPDQALDVDPVPRLKIGEFL